MEIKVLNQNGSGDSNFSLPESVFGQDFNADLVHQLIITYTANGHQNTKGQKKNWGGEDTLLALHTPNEKDLKTKNTFAI